MDKILHEKLFVAISMANQAAKESQISIESKISSYMDKISHTTLTQILDSYYHDAWKKSFMESNSIFLGSFLERCRSSKDKSISRLVKDYDNGLIPLSECVCAIEINYLKSIRR